MAAGFGALTTDAQFTVLSWHPWLEAASGLPTDAVVGRSLLDLVPVGSRDDLAELFVEVLTARTTRILSSTFHQHLIRCAPEVPSKYFDAMQQLVTVAPFPGEEASGLLITIEDVTLLREHDRRLAEQLTQGAVTGTSLADGVVSSDWRIRSRSLRSLQESADDEDVAQLLRSLESRHYELNVLSSALQALVVARRDVARPLIRLLKNCDSNLRMHAAQALGLMHERSALPELLAALDDEDPNVRFHVIDALGRLQAPEAIDPLVRIAQSGDFFLAFPAVESLARIDDPFVVPGLILLLSEELLRPAVVDALGALGDEESVAPLVAGVNGGTLEPAAVAAALVQIHGRYDLNDDAGLQIRLLVRTAASPEGMERFCEAFLERREPRQPLVRVLGWLGSHALEVLVGALGDPTVATEVMQALEPLGGRAVDAVCVRLSSGARDARLAAATLLGRLGDRRACSVLMHALMEADADLRTAAASSLATLGDPQALDALLPLLGDPQANVRQAAIAAVNSIGAEGTSQRILSALASSDARTRESAVRVAGYFGHEACLPGLLEALADDDEAVRRAAIEQLPLRPDVKGPGRLYEALVRDTPRNRAAAAHALKSVDRIDERPLLDALDDTDSWVRYFAADALAVHGRVASIERLTDVARTDRAPHVRIAALRTLGALAAPELAAVAAEAVRATDDDLACTALAAIGVLPGAPADDLLRDAVHGSRPALRAAAIEVLAQRASDAVELLAEAVRLPVTPSLGPAAIGAMAQIVTRPGAARQKAVESLLHLGTEPEWRSAVVEVIARLPVRIAIEQLAAAMPNAPAAARALIVEALARLRHADASEVIVTMLADVDPAVRSAAVTALGRIGSTVAAQAVVALQRADPDPDVRRRALRVCVRHGWVEPLDRERDV